MSKILSIEVGATLTKLVELDYRDKTPRIYHCLTIKTPEGVYEDGYLKNIDSFAGEIKAAITQAGIKSKQVIVTVSSSKIANREIMIPAVKPSAVRALINANSMDYFPIDLSKYELGHILLDTVKSDDKTSKHRAIVLACEDRLLDGYRELCDKIGLHLSSVDYIGNSVFQVMRQEVKPEETEMVLSVDEHNTIATIISNNTIKLQRNIAYGVDGCIETMIESKAFTENTYSDCLKVLQGERRINIALSDATEIIDKAEDINLTEKELRTVNDMTMALSPLVGNAVRLVDLYNSRNVDNPIKKISIIGIGATISGLSKLFTNELGIKSVVVENIKGVNWSQVKTDGTSGEYAAAIGAAYAPVGFIAEDAGKSSASNVNYNRLSILLSVFFVALIAVMVMLSVLPYKEAKLENDDLKAKEKLYKPAEAVYNRFNDVLALYTEVNNAMLLTESNNDGLLLFLNELENKLPSDAIVTEFQSDNNECKMTLRVKDMEQAAKVIQTVRDFETVEDISIGTVSESEAAKIAEHNAQVKDAIEDGDLEKLAELETYFSFELICKYYPNGASNQ